MVVLAGGAGRRLGGAAKPALAVAGRPMLARVLAAVDDAAERVVVGPPSLRALVAAGVPGGVPSGVVGGVVGRGGGGVDRGVVVVQEEPAGGGPVAGLAAGLAEVSTDRVVVLAADLPLLTREAVGALLAALGGYDGAVFVDGNGRQQWLCGAWSAGALRQRLAGMAADGPLAGRAMRELVAPLRVVGVPVDGGGRPPWYDCDTPADLADAERRLT